MILFVSDANQMKRNSIVSIVSLYLLLSVYWHKKHNFNVSKYCIKIYCKIKLCLKILLFHKVLFNRPLWLHCIPHSLDCSLPVVYLRVVILWLWVEMEDRKQWAPLIKDIEIQKLSAPCMFFHTQGALSQRGRTADVDVIYRRDPV